MIQSAWPPSSLLSQSSEEYESEWKKINQFPREARVPQEMKRSFLLQINTVPEVTKELALVGWDSGERRLLILCSSPKRQVHKAFSQAEKKRARGHEEAIHVIGALVTDRNREDQSFSSDKTAPSQAASVSPKKHLFA